MKNANFVKIKGRQPCPPFFALPLAILQHPNFCNLSSHGARLLCNLGSQISIKSGRPYNNGDLCAAFSIMQERGFKSKETLNKAIKELLYYEFIILTKKGQLKRPNLYGFTFYAINHCNGKLDVKETRKPSSAWNNVKKKWKNKK